MRVAFQHEQVIPVWAVALCAAALGARSRMTPLLTALLGGFVIASTAPAIVRWFRRSVRPPAGAFPAIDREPARTRDANDAADLARMDDDGAGRP